VRNSTPTATSQDVSVVVLTKNSAPTIKACLDSVLLERPKEVIAVDAQSTDGTLSILEGYDVRVFVDTLKSFGHSRQVGVEVATAGYVMFVDSDVVLVTGCIQRMLCELNKYGWVGIHARVLSAENVSYWESSEDDSFLSFYGMVRPSRQISTTAALFRRDVLLRYPFDSFFLEAAEDVDLCRRLIEAHYMLGISSAVVYHLHRREFSAFVKQRYRNGQGIARVGMKYRERRIFVDPLLAAISYVIREAPKGKFRLIPYRLIDGAATFIGVLVGYSRVCSSMRGELSKHSS
jgi:glycosyltransferase involved in cell wall biosynthesis